MQKTRAFSVRCRNILVLSLFFAACVGFTSIFSILSTSAFALDDELIYRSDELLIRQTINGSIALENADKLQSLTAKLHLIPLEDYRQVIVDQTITPQPQYVDSTQAIFKFVRPMPSSLSFSIDTTLRTRNTYKQITRAVAFPISPDDIPQDMMPYLMYTDLIDTNTAVAAKARELAGNEQDLFAVAFTVAQWVSNTIDYDLETITADATQSATWVYEQKKGVCDELSVLYASMMRSLGVPTRFVSGISYTNSPLFSYPWSPHAWVEVYFPGYGWVPFDLTYKQFGFIDASHIAMQTAADANESATQYQWQGYSIDSVSVEPDALLFNSTLLDARSQIEDFAKPTVTLLRDKVSLTSASAIVVTLQNTKNYYVSAQLGLAAPEELLFPDGKQIQLFLRPFEEQTIFIPVVIAPGLSNRFEYQFPIAVTNYYRVLSNTTLFVSSSNPTYTSAEIRAMSANALAASQSKISAYVKPQCYVNQTARVNESIMFVCDIAHDGASTLADFTLCVANSCTKAALMPASISSFTFNLSFSSVGVKQVPVRMTINNRVQETITDVAVYDVPAISLTPLDVPTTLRFDESATLRFLLEKRSFTTPQRTVVRIFDKVPYIWNVGSLASNKELAVSISGSSLVPGSNTIPIIATFIDDSGAKYTYKSSIQIELVDVRIWQRLYIWLMALIA